MLKYVVFGLLLCLGGAFAYVRLTPVDVATYHVDPETAERPSVRGQFLVRAGGDVEPARHEMSRAELAARVEAVILGTARTELLDGDLSTGFASYVTRSGLWGFPDVASVKVVENPDGSASVLILSRQVYGLEDLGVNKARVEGWLAAV